MTNSNQLPLPKGWVWTQIQNISKTTSGGTPSRKNKDFFSGEIPWLKSGELADNLNINSAEESITLQALDYSSAKIIPKGSLLVALYGATVGKLGILTIDAAINQAICAIQPYPDVSPKYLFHYLSTYRKNFLNARKGGAQPNISQEIVKTAPVPLAPALEQLRILSKVEELFSFLDAGTESLSKVQAQLKRYRQAVLKHAFEGKLTETWRRTHKDQIESAQEMLAKATFQFLRKQRTWVPEITQSVVLPDGWAKGRLENLIYIAGRIGWRGLKAEEYTQDGPLFLSVYNLNKGNIVDLSESYHVTEERYRESPEIQLKNDDVLLAKDGAGIGKIGIVQGLTVKATVNSSLLVVRSGEVFRPKFLFYFLKGPRMQDLVRSRITGSATPHLFQRDIRNFDLLIPPILEQEQIINEIESRLSIADQTEIVIKQSLKRGGTLWQTILKDAFEGKLVPQDPTDEPAERLLQRIKDTRNYPSKSNPKGLISYVK